MRTVVFLKVPLALPASISLVTQTVSPGSSCRDFSRVTSLCHWGTSCYFLIFLAVERIPPAITHTHSQTQTHTILSELFGLPPGRNFSLIRFPSFFSCQIYLEWGLMGVSEGRFDVERGSQSSVERRAMCPEARKNQRYRWGSSTSELASGLGHCPRQVPVSVSACHSTISVRVQSSGRRMKFETTVSCSES